MNQEDLFKSYIDICNQALEKNKDRFPFNHLLSGFEVSDNVSSVRVEIIDDMQHSRFHLRLINGEIEYDETHCQSPCNLCHSKCGNSSDVWSVRASYLNDVVENPEQYIENPARLDWEWVDSKG